MFCSFFALPQSFAHFHHSLDPGRNLSLNDFGLTTQTQPNLKSTIRSSAPVWSGMPNFFCHDEFCFVSLLEAHQSCSFNGLTLKTHESVLHNSSCAQTVLKTDVDKVLTWREPARTLPSDYTAQSKALRSRAITKILTTTALKKASLSYRIYLPLLATCRCPKQVATLSVRRVSRYHNFPATSSSLCSCRGVAECGDPLVSPRTSANRIPQNFKCLSGNPNVFFHISTVVLSTNSRHF